MAFYSNAKDVNKKAPSRVFPKDRRTMILSLNKTDNTCDNWYNPKKKPGIIQNIKSLKSGPERFEDPEKSTEP